MAESIRTMLAPEGLFFFEAQYLLDIIDGVLDRDDFSRAYESSFLEAVGSSFSIGMGSN